MPEEKAGSVNPSAESTIPTESSEDDEASDAPQATEKDTKSEKEVTEEEEEGSMPAIGEVAELANAYARRRYAVLEMRHGNEINYEQGGEAIEA